MTTHHDSASLDELLAMLTNLQRTISTHEQRIAERDRILVVVQERRVMSQQALADHLNAAAAEVEGRAITVDAVRTAMRRAREALGLPLRGGRYDVGVARRAANGSREI